MTGESAATWHPGDGPDLPGLDEAVEAARPAMAGVVPGPGWTPHDWLDHFGDVAGYAGVIAAAYPVIAAAVLRDAAEAWRREYDERTNQSGSYGQTKIRAALRMAAGLAKHRADDIEKGDNRG